MSQHGAGHRQVISYEKNVIIPLLTLKLMLLYTAHHHAAGTARARPEPVRRPGKVCDLFLFRRRSLRDL